MAYFAYVKNTQGWCALTIIPQIIHDDAIGKREIVGQRHPLTDEEARLSINELVKRYPLATGIRTRPNEANEIARL